MATNCVSCSGPCEGKFKLTLKEGVWQSNPITVQILGICSSLAVTSKVENSLVMGLALIFVCLCSNLVVSLLRKAIPHRIRMIVEVVIIATFVILFDQFLKAFYWEMSKQLGPYVGLIITNCIVMGRAEAFASQNGPLLSMVDGFANGLGYLIVLLIIGFTRELMGTGAVFGYQILSKDFYTPCQVMILAPGAFFVLGLLIAIIQALKPSQKGDSKK